MQVERRPQSPLPSIPPLADAEEAASALSSGAAAAEASLERLEHAAETLVDAVQKLQDVFADFSQMLSAEAVSQKKVDASQREAIESGQTRQSLREARRRSRHKSNRSAGRSSDASAANAPVGRAAKGSGRSAQQDARQTTESAPAAPALAPQRASTTGPGGDEQTGLEPGAAREMLDPLQTGASSGPAQGAAAVASATQAATQDPVDRIIDSTARNEGGGRYDAWNPDDNGAGVSFGLIQFNQKAGSLPTLLQRMHDQDGGKFDQIFGPYAANLQSSAWVRGANLNDPDLKARMVTAGRDPEFQQVQRDLAREAYYDPASRLLDGVGLTSERAHAMAFDISVQYGVGGFASKLQAAVAGGGGERAILTRLADLSDTHTYDNNRRHRILSDPNLSDGPVESTPAPQPPPGQGGVYTVQPGDTLSGIAARFGTTWQELAQLNHLSNPNVIHPGQQIQLPGAPQPDPAPAPAPAPGPAPGPSYDWPQMQRGAKGSSVSELQRALAQSGFDPGPVDGDFGPKTEAAVRRFQQEHGLAVDGIVGPLTRGALEKALAGPAGADPAPATGLPAQGTPPPVQGTAPQASAPSASSTYTVQPGDTLSGIASRHGTTWQELARLNHLADPDSIFPARCSRWRTDRRRRLRRRPARPPAPARF